MLSFEGQRKLRDLLFEVMILEQKSEYMREDLCREPIFEPYAAFQRIAGDPNKRFIYVEDIQGFLLQNRFNQHYENCLMYIKQYETSKNSFHLSYTEFLESVFPIMNTRLREEVAQRDKYQFQDLLPFEVEKPLSELLNYEASYLQKLDRLKGELRDSDQNFSPINCFKAIDMETLGFIDDDAIRNFMIKNGTVLTDNQIYFIVKRINKNKSGQITLEEFTQFIMMQYTSQYDKRIERTRAKSFNVSNSYSDQQYTDFYLQRYNYTSNKKTDTSFHLSTTNHTKKNITNSITSSSDMLIDTQVNEQIDDNHKYPRQPQNQRQSEHRLAQTQHQKQDQIEDRIFLTSAKKKKNNNFEDVQYKRFSQSSYKQPKYPQKQITFGYDTSHIDNLSMEQIKINEQQKSIECPNISDVQLAKNNIFESSEKDPKRSTQQIMLGSTAQSFYVPNTQNNFFRNTTLSYKNQFGIFGSSTRGFSIYPSTKDPFEGEKKKEFQIFLKDLLTISLLDRNVESAKLEFLGLINFSPCNFFDYVDQHKRESIVFQEFYDFITLDMGFKSFTKRDCSTIFQYFDLNSRGYINKDDFLQKFTPLDRLVLSQKPYTPIHLLTDAEKTKLKLYFQQIVNNSSKVHDIKQNYNSRNNSNYNSLSLNELFNLLDRDNDSYLSIYDIKIRFEEQMIEVSKEDISFIFYRFDKNNFTKISFSDFIKEFSQNRI